MEGGEGGEGENGRVGSNSLNDDGSLESKCLQVGLEREAVVEGLDSVG